MEIVHIPDGITPKNIYSLIDNWRKCEKMAEIGKNIRLDMQTRRSGR